MDLHQVKHGVNENAEPANNKQGDVNACCDSGKYEKPKIYCFLCYKLIIIGK
jgi:hypothetical protein